MPEPIAKTDNASPFRLVLDLMLADETGDYSRAAVSQSELARLGWFVSRKKPDRPKRGRRKQADRLSDPHPPKGSDS
jgi:hypothetical protein